jgi:hypothetical protein
MGPCQGRICGAATEFLFGWGSALVQSNMRPPVFPALVSSLAIPCKNACVSDSVIPAGTSAGTQKEPL